MRRTSRLAVGLTTAVLAAVGLGSAPAVAAGPNSFTLHLTCDNGQSYDIFVNDAHSVAAHVEGSTAVAVLKNGNGTVVPAFSDTGPHAGTLVSCDTGIPGFTALVLFTPANQP
jgi:TRAP-type mannitol/chloroaromatic compound transport system substrate-binding protein